MNRTRYLDYGNCTYTDNFNKLSYLYDFPIELWRSIGLAVRNLCGGAT